MPLYQLPTGRTVHLSMEEFLSLTDDEIQRMVAFQEGEDVCQPWLGSYLHNPGRQHLDESIVPDEFQDDSLFGADDIEELLDNDNLGDA